MSALLEVEGLTVAFGRAVALRGVSLTVGEGETVGVLGANGAGKTTLLRAIHGRAPKAAGYVRFRGADVAAWSTNRLVRAGVALCPENRRLFPSMSIEDNLLLGAHGWSRRVARDRLARTYDRFPWIGERRRELAGRLSGGEQQIVTIARSLMADPKLLLLDEPSSGLAPVAIERIRELIVGVRESGTTILLVEQNVKLVAALCETAWVLARGEVTEHGATSELMAGVRVADAYLGGIEITDGKETSQ